MQICAQITGTRMRRFREGTRCGGIKSNNTAKFYV